MHKVLLLALLAAQNLPQPVRLLKVLVRDGDLLGEHGAGPLLVLLAGLDGAEFQRAEGGRVVWVCAIVAVDGHGAVTLVRVECAQRAVDGDLLVVYAQTVAVGVGIGEEAGLEDWVGRGLGAGDHVRGGEGGLLNLRKVVLGVLVEGDAAEFAEGDFTLRPDLGQVKDIPAELLGLFWAEDLHVAGPGRAFALVDGFEEVLGVPVGVLRGQLAGFLVVEGLVALVGLQVDLDVVEATVWLDPLVGVARVTVHVAVGVWGTTVTEQMHDLVDGFLMGGEVVPEHGGILQVGLGVPLLSVDKQRELGRVSDEEDWGVVEHPVPVALLGVELDGKATRITSAVGRALLSTHGREAGDELGFLSHALEHIGNGLVLVSY